MVANISDAELVPSNSTSDLSPQQVASLIAERQVTEDELLLTEEGNSTKSSNSSESEQSGDTKAERAVVVIIT